MKEKELRKHANCDLCRQKILAGGIPLFYRVTIERFGVLLKSVERQQGLTMMLGNSAVLASVMGADEDMAKAVMEPLTITVCESCSTERRDPIAALAEIIGDREEATDHAHP